MSSNLTDPVLREQDVRDQEDQLSPEPSLLTGLTGSSSLSSYSAIPRIANDATNALALTLTSSPHPFYISPPRSPQIMPAFQQTLITTNIDMHQPTFFMMSESKSERDDDDHASKKMNTDIVSQKLINSWNTHYGDLTYKKKAKKLIKKMREMGGLDPSKLPLDIPEARMGLLILAGLNDQECKMDALCSLLEILKKDKIEKSSCNRLVKLAVDLLNQMAREVLQQSDLEAQIKISEVYNVLTENLHHHYGKEHINGITKELKDSLDHAPASLEKLNRLENIKIKYNTHCALESVHRLKDDRQELFELVERLYNLVVAASSLYMQDAQFGFPRLEEAFKNINVHLPNSWYNSILILKNLARNVKDNPNHLTPLLMLIGKKYQKLNWKFTYAAVEILTEIVLNGQTEAVRLRAFGGIKQFGKDFPGLASFADCEELKSYASLKPITHLELPRKVDPNIRIREACMESLIKIVESSQDPEIVEKAERILKRRAQEETDEHILALIQRPITHSRTVELDEFDKVSKSSSTFNTPTFSSISEERVSLKGNANSPRPSKNEEDVPVMPRADTEYLLDID